MVGSKHKYLLMMIVITTIALFVRPVESADVIILGDTKLKPVADVVNGIKETLPYDTIVKRPSNVKGKLKRLIEKNGIRAVIALGKDAVIMSHALPESIPVVYGLVIKPLKTDRPNITGVYMQTPVSEYISFIDKYFPKIKTVGIVCEHETQKDIKITAKSPKVKLCGANNPYEFIEEVNSLGDDVDALILLPERKLITSKVLEQVYLYSFREKRPVIGISEKYVKTGSLFSLGFQTYEMGKQIGSMTNRVVSQGSTSGIPHSPPDNYSLYINKKTADSMNIHLPEELLSRATKVYP